MINFPRHWLYYLSSFALGLLSAILLWSLNIFVLPIGLILFGSSIYFCLLGLKLEKENANSNSSNEYGYTEPRIVNTEGGSYTESNYGDYITVQDNRIYLNQDTSQITTQIEEVLALLQSQGYSQNAAAYQIADELKPQLYRNPRAKRTIFRWKNSLRSSRNSSFETSKPIAKIAELLTDSSDANYDLTQGAVGSYQELEEFLKKGDWKGADEATLLIIAKLMPKRNYAYTNKI
jgi:hypothetical protein